MQPIKNWSKIWKIERIFYKISNEISLPRPVTQTFLIWLALGFFLSLKMKGIFPFAFNSALVNHLAVPFAIALFLNKKTFQGRKPYSYLFSLLRFLVRPKTTRRASIAPKTKNYTEDHTILMSKGSEHFAENPTINS